MLPRVSALVPAVPAVTAQESACDYSLVIIPNHSFFHKEDNLYMIASNGRELLRNDFTGLSLHLTT